MLPSYLDLIGDDMTILDCSTLQNSY